MNDQDTKQQKVTEFYLPLYGSSSLSTFVVLKKGKENHTCHHAVNIALKAF